MIKAIDLYKNVSRYIIAFPFIPKNEGFGVLVRIYQW